MTAVVTAYCCKCGVQILVADLDDGCPQCGFDTLTDCSTAVDVRRVDEEIDMWNRGDAANFVWEQEHCSGKEEP